MFICQIYGFMRYCDEFQTTKNIYFLCFVNICLTDDKSQGNDKSDRVT